jgi:hypothetical protein
VVKHLSSKHEVLRANPSTAIYIYLFRSMVSVFSKHKLDGVEEKAKEIRKRTEG